MLFVNACSEIDDTFNVALSAMGLPPIPKSFSKAMEDPNRWLAAIQKEINRLMEFGVFGPPQDPPSNVTILFALWVFAHKLNGTGDIIDEKARLVVNELKQEEGVDYFQTFAAVLHFESLCILIALWVILGFHIWQINFSSAYLNGDLNEEIYVWIPEGYEGFRSGKVMHLNKSIYGLMQVGRNWWKTLDVWYKEVGYICSQVDQCIQTKVSETGETITGTYTDDTLGGSSSVEEMKRAKAEIGRNCAICIRYVPYL